MHRKFIALIVSSAIAITGFSALPARAGDTERLLGGLAALTILGIALHQREKRKDRRRQVAPKVHHNPVPQQHSIRPLPDRVAKYNLPAKCLKQREGYRGKGRLLGPRCLKRHYDHSDSLPRACKISYWNGDRNRRAYEMRCLRQHGYRVAGRH